MKYRPPYRIETGKVYQYDNDQKAYMFYGTKLSLTKDEYQKIQKEIRMYDKNYDRKEGLL